MFNTTSHDLTILDYAQGGYLTLATESFLIDRKATGLSPHTIRFYKDYLTKFIKHCDSQAITLIQQVGADFLRRYLLVLGETHNAGGVHGMFRTLRAFFNWVESEEVMPPNWKNPIKRVRAPKVGQEPIEPVPLDDVKAMLDICPRNEFIGDRDRAILLFLLDTGVRAQELCSINVDDVDPTTGCVTVRQGKGRKPRLVFVGKKIRKALRTYQRHRQDRCPALFVAKDFERLTADGLRQLLQRIAKRAGLVETPSPHDFRRAFALNMLRNKVNIFALQRMMGHADLSILRRYLAQTEQDIQDAHMQGSPVDNSL